MKIVIAPQALKGSLDAIAVGAAIAAGANRATPWLIEAFGAPVEVVVIPVADGGEGTTRALVAATGGQLRTASVMGPLGESVMAEYGVLGCAPTPGPSPASGRGERRGEGRRGGKAGHGASPGISDGALAGEADDADDEATIARLSGVTAVVEMASAAGLPLVSPERRNPLDATTYGVGELIRLALDAGCAQIIVGLGGSATNDGGAGMAQALGARLLDADGAELPPGGAALARLARIDASGLAPRLSQTRLLVACDVANPLVGPEGASAVYGPQKGATPAMIAQLDAALARYAAIIQRDLGRDVGATPGAGAAGGLGAGLLAFTQARLIPGAQLVLGALDFAARVQGAQVVITAEGRLDGQTAYGKSVGAVAAMAHAAGAHVVALVGALAANDATLAALAIDVAAPIADGPLTLDESMERAADLLSATATRTLRLLALGARLKA